jgi:FKBP-type peptidyl-prolyl cis-trans isomerase FkpA
MNSTLIKLSLFTVAIASVFTACKNGGSLQTDAVTGVQYQIITHNDKGTKPTIGDYARVEMIGKAVTNADKDTVIFNSSANRNPKDTGKGTFNIPLQKSFNGCLEQGLTLFSTGDSGVIKLSADSLFLKTFRSKELPKFVKPGSMVTINVKLLSFQTKEQVMQLQQAEQAKRMAEMAQRKSLEGPAIAKYLADNHYTSVKPTKDSLFVLSHTTGKGKAIKDGDSVKVTYNGTTLDGVVFDASSKHPGGPLALKYSHDMQLIKGWVEMLGTMHEGDKAKILLPSAIAYGERKMGNEILPYTPLLFDLEVVKVTSNK